MATYDEIAPLDYRLGGDTIDDFAQKYMREISRIYQFLNNVREHNSDGTYSIEPQPYQFKAENGKLYIRNSANDAWLYLFDVAYRMGMSSNAEAVILTSDDVTSTAEALKLVKTNADGDIDANITGNATKFGNRLAADYITVDDVSTEGVALKIVKTDSDGLANISISGNAAKFGNKTADAYVLQEEVSTTGEASKLVKTDSAGMANVNISGNATMFGSKTADAYVLQAEVSSAGEASKIVKTDSTGTANVSISGSAAKFNGKEYAHFITEDNVVSASTSTEILSAAGKIPTINATGLLPVSINGNAGKLADKEVAINDPADGQVLTYRSATGTWRNEDKGGVGSSRALSLNLGEDEENVIEYAGEAANKVDVTVDGGTINFTNTITDKAGNVTTKAGSITIDNVANATNATNATNDSSGNKITDTYAPLASPALTGTPTAPTAATGTANTQIATTEFVNNRINGIKMSVTSAGLLHIEEV